METYALTFVYLRPSLFARTGNAELLVKVLFDYRDQGYYRLHGFAVLAKYLEVLLTPFPNRTIERCAGGIKGDFADQVRTQFPGAVWQPVFREHFVRNAEDFRGELKSIAADAEKLGLVDWSWVNSEFRDRLDPMPEWLR
jgi:REP element-mobilizing transposase RayT